jgi:hypothetical protein
MLTAPVLLGQDADQILVKAASRSQPAQPA